MKLPILVTNPHGGRDLPPEAASCLLSPYELALDGDTWSSDLYAFGERLLIRSGRRDSYGSRHHRNWMWQTRSVNSITVNGRGQIAHSPVAVGRINRFHTSPGIDFVQGEAERAYLKGVKRFTRAILFVKPDLIVIRDQLETAAPSTFEWHLHAPVPFEPTAEDTVRVVHRGASCRVRFLAPEDLEITTTDQFDPPPRPRVKLTEYHLTARTTERALHVTILTVIQPWKTKGEPPAEVELEAIEGGLLLRTDHARVLARTTGRGKIAGGGLWTTEDLAAWVEDDAGEVRERFGATD